MVQLEVQMTGCSLDVGANFWFSVNILPDSGNVLDEGTGEQGLCHVMAKASSSETETTPTGAANQTSIVAPKFA